MKLFSRVLKFLVKLRFPRARARGPIEAERRLGDGEIRVKHFPRARARGPIEAMLWWFRLRME